ncbi:unnamed protein product [Timema podura]|uniref:Trehalase n=1 Tax=Timema podura TaxID=61482 RepID=A0ABN7PEV8_TIMPD|nr:unnamed protein product [Timema podura]
MSKLELLFVACVLLLSFEQLLSDRPPCDSEIFCHGRLLHEVQTQFVYSDCKTFVDMKLKYPQSLVLKSFNELVDTSNGHLTRTKLEVFLRENFERVASEFESWTPNDWTDQPEFLTRIIDPKLKEFGSNLNSMWKYLGRKIKEDVRDNQEQYSMIYVPNPLIIPGGRFREFYYWDSYWICKGLLHSEMYDTVKGMIYNYISLVKTFGLVPNGGRLYYVGRSQPPMLIPMINDYYQFTRDIYLIKNNIWVLEKEFSFWMTNRSVQILKDGKSYNLLRFNDETCGPRPESYREDYVAADGFKTEKEKNDYYKEIKAAAESGRDFTSRWYVRHSGNKGSLIDTKTRQIIPVDLNAIIEWNARLLAEFFTLLNQPSKASYYATISQDFKIAIEKILWHDDLGTWLDYDFVNHKRRNYFYPSNLAPLWSTSYETGKADYYADKVVNYLTDNVSIHKYPGGVPSSDYHTGEQWDYPNTWSPLQDMIITGLHNTNNPRALELSKKLAQKVGGKAGQLNTGLLATQMFEN